MKLKQPKMPEVVVGSSGPSQAGWHQVADFLDCMKRGQFKHIRGIRVPTVQQKPAFAVGSLVHAGRARWFGSAFKTDQKTIDAVHEAMKREARLSKEPMTAESERFALTIVDEYINFWSGRMNPEVGGIEYDLGPAPLQNGDPLWLMRTAKLDDFGKYAESGRELAIGELKTTSQGVAACVQEYTLHGQTMLQQWLWRVAKQGAAMHGPVKGTVLDIAVKGYGTKKPTFAREFIPFSEHQFEWFVDSLRGYLKAIVSIDANSSVPRNPVACTKQFDEGSREIRYPCEYRELCKWGKAKAIGYVDAKGNQLHRWQPSVEQQVPPWA